MMAGEIPNKPVAWMRRWSFDGEAPKKERNEAGRMVWPYKFKLLPVTMMKCLSDDVPLYAIDEARKEQS